MIKWRHPSSVPRDGSYFAIFAANGVLNNCQFDQDEQDGCFIITSMTDLDKRTSLTLAGFIGWARWPDVFAHIRDTASLVDSDEIKAARDDASYSTFRLGWFARKSEDEAHKTLALDTIATIERILKLLPPGSN